MRHLKFNRLFESNEELDKIIIEISSGCNKNHTPSGRIKIFKFKPKTFKIEDVYDSIVMSKEYLEDDFYFYSFICGESDSYGYIESIDRKFDFELYEKGRGRLINKPLNFLQLIFKKKR